MGTIILLRNLTFKSVINWGMYKNLTVQDILTKDRKGLDYLCWTYYNCSNITFVQEILDIIGITSYFEVTKPGKANNKKAKFLCHKLRKKHYKSAKQKDICSDIMMKKMGDKQSKIYNKIRMRSANRAVQLQSQNLMKSGNYQKRFKLTNNGRNTT